MITKEKILSLVDEVLTESQFIVELEIDAANRIYIEVDDKSAPISITDCINVSRGVEHNLDREIEDFSLEVTSPGLDRPFKVFKQYLKNITIKQYGLGCFIIDAPTSEDIKAAKNGLEEIQRIIKNGKHDMIILDEVNIALYFKLLDVDEILSLLENKPDHVEIILTGRYAPPEIIEMADLVTEMKEIKHYYQEGIQARKGIEF